MKKGFTLIELMAVILILGVIALIAIPAVSNVIDESKKNAAKVSAKNYVGAVEEKIMLDNITGKTISNGIYTVKQLSNRNIEIKGTKPDDISTIKIKNGEVVECNLIYDTYKVTYNNNEYEVNEDAEKSLPEGNTLKKFIDIDNERMLNDLDYNAQINQQIDESDIHNKTKVIRFVDYIDTTNAVRYWDASEEQNNSIIAWLEQNSSDNNMYDMYIGSEKVIYAPVDSSWLFCGMAMLESILFDNFSTSNVNNMAQMFEYTASSAKILNLDLSVFDTSNVTDMTSMFEGIGYDATVFNIENLSNFDTSKVENMNRMFIFAGNSATTFNLDLSNWNTSNVTDMSYMFEGAGQSADVWEIGDLLNWDTSNVINMESMFMVAGMNATNFNLNLSGWDTSKVTNMHYMFSFVGRNSETFNLNLSGWTISKSNMRSMFQCTGDNATTFNLDLTGWNTSLIENMSYMFYLTGYNADYKLDLTGWNVSSVTNHEYFNYKVDTKVVPPVWPK